MSYSVLFFFSCVSYEKNFKSIIKNYDTASASHFLRDSCIFKYKSRADHISKLLNGRSSSGEYESTQLKGMVRVIPVLNIDSKALEYDYSQNFLSYIREVKPSEGNRYIGFIVKDSILIMEIHALKLKGKSWTSNGTSGPYPENGDPFLQKLMKDYPNNLFFCIALQNYCVVKNGELLVCRRESQQLQTLKEYFNSYYPLKSFKEDLVKYFN